MAGLRGVDFNTTPYIRLSLQRSAVDLPDTEAMFMQVRAALSGSSAAVNAMRLSTGPRCRFRLPDTGIAAAKVTIRATAPQS
jgi:hypothetical protein